MTMTSDSASDGPGRIWNKDKTLNPTDSQKVYITQDKTINNDNVSVELAASINNADDEKEAIVTDVIVYIKTGLDSEVTLRHSNPLIVKMEQGSCETMLNSNNALHCDESGNKGEGGPARLIRTEWLSILS